MRALSIRQPYAELILRGVKTVEYRSRPTRIVGERFWIYATKRSSQQPAASLNGIWSSDLGMPLKELPEWMIELAQQVKMMEPGALLPTGVIVGSAVIEKVEEVAGRQMPMDGFNGKSHIANCKSMFRWHLADVQRVSRLRTPHRQPQPVWFKPF